MDKFFAIKIGDKAQIKHVITLDDIKKFVELTGDDNKLHVDADYAGKTEFKKPVVHGMLGASFISTTIGTKIPGDGALWFSQNLEFLLPARVGDELTIIAEVINKFDKTQTIELSTDIFNQNKQKITAGTAKVKVVGIVEATGEEKSLSRIANNVLIIGATGGIGAATCQRLAKDGFNIAIHYNKNKGEAERLLNKIEDFGVKGIIVTGNLLDSYDITEMFSHIQRKLGSINIFINCATLKVPNIKFDKMEWSDMEGHLNLNIKSNFLLLQQILPSMKDNGGGKIIFITTQYTESTPPTEISAYVTAKYALNGFAKSMAVELAQYQINVNLVSPGMTQTDLIADLPEKARLLAAAKTPLKRLARPEDVASVISFLASQNANYLTGETIRINGGQTML